MEREKEILVVSSENESEGRQKNCCAKMNGEEIIDQSQGQVELEHGKQVLRQGFGEFSKLELVSCSPKKLFGFKTKRGLFEWVIVEELNNMLAVESEKNIEIICRGEQGISKAAMEARRIFAKGKEEILAKEQELKVDEVDHVDFIGVEKYNFHPQYQLGSFFNELRRIELKIDNVEHIDFIGMDCFDVHPNILLIEFFNKLRRIALQHDLNFKEFCFIRRIKRRRYSKYLFSRQGRKELSHVESRQRNGK
ncbi:hypothetical protein LguiA_033627 [Lonicera macranthoides]